LNVFPPYFLFFVRFKIIRSWIEVILMYFVQ
jgi:hypothetical protein